MLNKLSLYIILCLSKMIKCYIWLISPFLGNNCRFYPSCSNYFLQCLTNFGVIKGSYLGFWRILRCNPYNKSFGLDEPPTRTIK